MSDINAIQLEIIRSAFVAAAEEMNLAVRQTARSMMIREGRDFSTAIFDIKGRNVAQAALLPIHLNTMAPALESVLTDYIPPQEWCEGDVVLVNDPYCGAQHLPDLTTFKPVFVDGKLSGFVGVMAHHTDIGGGAPGSYSLRATEIFAEGLRIPPVKLVAGGVLNDVAMKIILQNVRQPDILRGDLMSQIGALEIGSRALQNVANKYGKDVLVSVSNRIIDQSLTAMRAAIAALPDGVYSFEDVVDNELEPSKPIPLKVALTIAGDKVTVDFTGSAAQVDMPINCTLNIARSCIYYAVMTGIAEHVPQNSGCYAAIDVIAPKGSIVNCNYPAAVVNRISVGHRIVNVIMGALAKAQPGKIPAAPYGATYLLILESILESGQRKIFFDGMVGGWGGEPHKDGANALPCGLHNGTVVPIEMHESASPILFTEQSLRSGSGGAGQFRGGLGLVKEIMVNTPTATLTATLNRVHTGPYGLEGGEPGQCAKLTLFRADGSTETLDRLVDRMPLVKGDRLRIETAGGGGYGPVSARDPAAITADRLGHYAQ